MPTVGALNELNAATRATALRMLEAIVERSAWVAERAVDQRPFASDQDVAQSLVDTILTSSFERRVALFRAHPELAGREAAEGRMTEASTSEQGRLGLTSLEPGDAERLTRMNAAHAARFGYPFILALHRVPNLQAVFDIFEGRLTASPVEEHVSTLAEIASVIGARARSAFGASSGAHSVDRPGAAVEGEITVPTSREVTNG
jgi:OHCU decarboxylase